MGMKAYPTYKDSGVQWLAEVPSSWNVFPAKQVFADSKERRRTDDTFLTASQKYGVISQQRYMQLIGGRIVQASQDFDKWKHVEPDDFVISLRSFQGGLEMCTERGCVTWHYVVLKPKAEIIPLYFKWLFKSYLYIKSLQSTCNFIRDGQDLRYSNFVQVPIPVPSLDEQKAIASFLDKKCAEIDELVSRRQAIIERLKELKQSIIADAVTKGLKPEVPMKDSRIPWLGKIPSHWKTEKLTAHFQFGKGLSITKADLQEKGIPVISYGQIHSRINNGVDVNDRLIRYVDARYKDSAPKALVNSNDIVFADTSEDVKGIGNCVRISCESDIFAGYHTIIAFNKGKINTKYWAYLFQSDNWRNQLRIRTNGVKVFSISQKNLRRCNLITPPVDEQQSIVAYLDKKCAEIDELVVRQEQIIEKLKELKTSTIAHVVTGKVDVRDAI